MGQKSVALPIPRHAREWDRWLEDVCCDCGKYPCARLAREKDAFFNRWRAAVRGTVLGNLFDLSCWEC